MMDGIEASYIPLTEEERRAPVPIWRMSLFRQQGRAIVQALRDIGELDNTIVIVTADHGDMLSERGLWYKMNFFEHSSRVPMIMAGPSIVQGVTQSACSLVDPLPRLLMRQVAHWICWANRSTVAPSCHWRGVR